MRPRIAGTLLLMVWVIVAAVLAAGGPARAFLAQVEAELKEQTQRVMAADWIKNTYLTEDTAALAAAVNEELLAVTSRHVRDARRFQGQALDPESRRKLHLLRLRTPLAAPSDPAQRRRLAKLREQMDAAYSRARDCGPEGRGPCQDLQQVIRLFATNRDAETLRNAWLGWHRQGRLQRPRYTEFVAAANVGAREFGFADMGEMWRSAYDMPPAAFAREIDRLWRQVRPFYEALHCHVRGRLARAFAGSLPADGSIPAHLVGNLWSQDWSTIYPLVEPFPGKAGPDVSAALARGKFDPIRAVTTGESFFTSMGLPDLPKSFWQRSIFTKPAGREMTCFDAAYDVSGDGDLRLKMCVQPNAESFATVHDELAQIYYLDAYRGRPELFRRAANEAFDQAVGSTVTLSITPAYLARLGLADHALEDEQALINRLMQLALDQIVFLPFARAVDEWRWGVLAGQIPPSRYNRAWWELRRRYQGIVPPSPRTEEDFDPGAKRHIPANLTYIRYFVSYVLRFQLHRALCHAAGVSGPLTACSVHGSREAGKRLWEMMSLGASRPWQEALAKIAGERTLDASAMLEYFAPLRGWLDRQNGTQRCGW